MANDPRSIDDALLQGRTFIRRLDKNCRIALAFHDDPDGVSASVVAAKCLEDLGYLELLHFPTDVGETVHNFSMLDRIDSYSPGAMIVLDMGSREGELLDIPTLVIDDHVMKGKPLGATFVNASAWGGSLSTSSLVLALFAGLSDIRSLVWKSAVGIVGDLGLEAAQEIFPDLRDPEAITEWASLIDASKRSSWHDIETVHRFLMDAKEAGEIRNGLDERVARLRRYRDEVDEETRRSENVKPYFADDWVLLLFSSPCAVQGPVATEWAHRLPHRVVMAANAGLSTDQVHFSVRSGENLDLIECLETNGADLQDTRNFAMGHPWATGGGLPVGDFVTLLRNIGFSREVIDETARRQAGNFD